MYACSHDTNVQDFGSKLFDISLFHERVVSRWHKAGRLVSLNKEKLVDMMGLTSNTQITGKPQLLV